MCMRERRKAGSGRCRMRKEKAWHRGLLLPVTRPLAVGCEIRLSHPRIRRQRVQSLFRMRRGSMVTANSAWSQQTTERLSSADQHRDDPSLIQWP